MNTPPDTLGLDGVPIVRLESSWLRVDVAPSVGGRIVSIVDRSTGHEFLWRHPGLPLRCCPPGTEYDPNFFGGIDELLPNDLAESINGIACPDHGELWTLPLEGAADNDRLLLQGILPRFGLRYERRMSLRSDAPQLDLVYRISNPTSNTRTFLWKLHAALPLEPGDIIDCPARSAQVVDLNYSRFSTLSPFAWPMLGAEAVNVMSQVDGTVDFFYLFDLEEGRIGWRRPGKGLELSYHFDPRIFPFAWLFASSGGFLGHRTVVLEPCTAMPISVNEAAAKHQCSVLQPGESMETQVSIRARRFQE